MAPLPDDAALLAKVDDYIERLFAPRDEVLDAVLRDAAAAGLPPIQVSATEGRLLQLLVELTGASRVLEIGTLGGYSSVWMARALPPGGRLVTLELDPRHAAVARRSIDRAGLSDRVEVRVGRGLDLLAELAADAGAEPFDVVFIDADKDAYPEYLAAVVPMVREGGLILADNVIRAGAVLDPASSIARAVAHFNELVAADPRLSATIVPFARDTVDGLAIIRVRPLPVT